jgi:hypothetical protein
MSKKPWTFMVYLAADNNLTNFGIDSLRQMKAVAGSSINVVAEFDTGPLRPTKRYLFDGGTMFGSLEQNMVGEFGPISSADPDNLAEFIRWTAKHYPAEHYFLVIWGHGAGVDDDFPHAPDRTFVVRHRLLNLTKGMLDVPKKGMLDVPKKGMLEIPPKSVLDVFPAEVSNMSNRVLNALETGILKPLHDAVAQALSRGVKHALEERILVALRSANASSSPGNGHAHHTDTFSPTEHERLIRFRTELLATLQERVVNSLKLGPLANCQQQILDALHAGIEKALQTDVIYDLQSKVLASLSTADHIALAEKASHVVNKGILRMLEDGVLDALDQEFLAASQQNVRKVKSLAFDDHPQSYLTNQGLKEALAKATRRIGRKIDIVGMDACNMGMVEIGYQIRESADFLIASQDDIPDASWPYTQLLAQLASNPLLLPRDLARLTTNTYITAYRDYIEQPVTLSALDLRQCDAIRPLIQSLAHKLGEAINDLTKSAGIDQARRQVRSFGQDQFVDLVHLCEILTGVSGNQELVQAASSFKAAFAPFIISNTSAGESNCNGTSIYFPPNDASQFEHQERMQRKYNQLDFSEDTKWGHFLASLLKRQREEHNALVAFQRARPTPEMAPV